MYKKFPLTQDKYKTLYEAMLWPTIRDRVLFVKEEIPELLKYPKAEIARVLGVSREALTRFLNTEGKKLLTWVFCFAIVLSTANGVHLSWEAPTTNEDGTPLTDLAGYKIYYGTSSGVYDHTVDVGLMQGIQLSRYMSVGITYYFVATAYNTARIESEYSNEVSKTVTMEDKVIMRSGNSNVHLHGN